MVLEALTNPRRVNIRNLTIENPQRIGVPFDPKDKITGAEWRGILVQLEDLKNARQNITDTSFDQAVIITSLMLCDPQRVSGLDINPTLDYLSSRVIDARDTGGGFLQEYVSLMIISPMRAKECTENPRVQGHINTLKWFNRVLNQEPQHVNGTQHENLKHLDTLFRQSSEIKIAFPGIPELDYSFLGRCIEDEIVFIRAEEDKYKKAGDSHYFYDFLYSLAALKILFPYEFSENGVLGEQRWKLIEDGFRKLRKRFADASSKDISTAILLESCNYIKILAAEEVIVTEQEGLKLIMPSSRKDFVLLNPAMPERRKF